jgi:BioD-like phosphotransacetylase family protein
MMVALYVTSIGRHTGKDLVAMGLMDRLRRDGFKVGYFKPMGRSPTKAPGSFIDSLHWQTLLNGSAQSLLPVT